MKRKCSLFLAVVLLCFCGAGLTRSDAPKSLALTHVTVINVTDGSVKPDATVAIADGRITAVGEYGKVLTPEGSQVVDATGKFLIPGLWDMHVHWDVQDFGTLFIANGVTGVRVMWGDPHHHAWRKEIEAGQMVGPRMAIASSLIDGPRPMWQGSTSVSTEAEARAAVVEAKSSGADFIKVYTFLPREEYFAIVDEARKQGLPFAGHLPLSVSAEEASQAGQKSFEHLLGIPQACSSRQDEMRKAELADLDDALSLRRPTLWGAHQDALRQQSLDTYSPEKAAALFALFKRNGTWQCPTLTLLHMITSRDDAALVDDPRLKYMPLSFRQSWRLAIAGDQPFGKRTPENFALQKKEWKRNLEIVGAMQKAGVGILAGTDTQNPFCMPGFSLHDELGFLVKGGLSPLEALQAATANPARFLGKESDLGTVATGKFADLVLLDANPLDDIANTKKIAGVVTHGKYYSRASLDGMLAQEEALAARKSIADVLSSTTQEKGVQAAIAQYHELKKTQPAAYEFSENELITFGYSLLHFKRYKDAIEIFKLSVEEYPQSYNTYDSLAEAYMDNGDKDLAIQNYEKSLQLNPNNKNGIEMLKKLRTP